MVICASRAMQSDGTNPDLTTLHVRGAVGGDDASRGWIVERFSPLLRMQLDLRLRGAARNYCDPEDLLQEVWTVTLSRLPALQARDGRWTPVLVKYLSTTLMHLINAALRNYIRGDRPRRELSGGGGGASLPSLHGMAGSAIDPGTAASDIEMRERMRAAIAELAPRDREVVTMRGIEQQPNKHVAEQLGETEPAVSIRYQRALGRLRAALPGSVFDELPDSGGKSC
jgi:RNA polymerase sigma-70 factor, ECF subfamily